MDDYKNYHIPAFGSWDVNSDLPITQYFESARQAGLVRYTDCTSGDLYKVHDLQYRAGPRTVSHAKAKEGSKSGYYVREEKKQCKVCDMTAPQAKKNRLRAVDEDLYKIPPELLRHKSSSSKGKVMGMLTSCLGPGCIA